MSAMMRNGSGYISPVEDAALRSIGRSNAEEVDDRASKLFSILRKLIDFAGFDLLNRIELVDRKTGRRYR